MSLEKQDVHTTVLYMEDWGNNPLLTPESLLSHFTLAHELSKYGWFLAMVPNRQSGQAQQWKAVLVNLTVSEKS